MVSNRGFLHHSSAIWQLVLFLFTHTMISVGSPRHWGSQCLGICPVVLIPGHTPAGQVCAPWGSMKVELVPPESVQFLPRWSKNCSRKLFFRSTDGCVWTSIAAYCKTQVQPLFFSVSLQEFCAFNIKRHSGSLLASLISSQVQVYVYFFFTLEHLNQLKMGFRDSCKFNYKIISIDLKNHPVNIRKIFFDTHGLTCSCFHKSCCSRVISN